MGATRGAFSGIDVDAAAGVVVAWDASRHRVADTVARAVAAADEMALDVADVSVVRVAGGSVVDELAASARLLADRAGTLAALDWTGTSATFGWASGRRHGPPGERVEELLAWLATGPRGHLITELAAPDDERWRAMVAGRTLVEGHRTMRYFDVATHPGAGVIVVDFFIPEDNSLIVEGDGRDHADPVFGPLTDGDSRMLLVLDLEAGRGSVQFDDTCLAGGVVCNEARPIELGGREVVWAPSSDLVDHLVPTAPLPIDLIEIPNQVSVDSTPGRIEIDYDVLNGIIPVLSVDGTITLASDGGGRYRVDDIDTDRYPSIGVYQYRAGEQVEVLARQDSAGVLHAAPWVPSIIAGVVGAAEAVASASATILEKATDLVAGGDGLADLVERQNERSTMTPHRYHEPGV